MCVVHVVCYLVDNHPVLKQLQEVLWFLVLHHSYLLLHLTTKRFSKNTLFIPVLPPHPLTHPNQLSALLMSLFHSAKQFIINI